MRFKNYLKPLLLIIMTICCSLVAAESYYTLQDDDVVIEDGMITDFSANLNGKIVTIPEILSEQTVTGIQMYSVFEEGIDSLILPNTLTRVAGSYWANGLLSIALPLLGDCYCWVNYNAYTSNPIYTYLDNGSRIDNFDNDYVAVKYHTLQSSEVDFDNNTITRIDDSINLNITRVIVPDTIDGESVIGCEVYNRNMQLMEFPSTLRRLYISTDATMPDIRIEDFDGWTDGYDNYIADNGTSVWGGMYYAIAPYVLKDEDVIVENGVITEHSSFYTKLIFPDTLDNQKIIGIGDYVFSSNLSSVVLPKNLVYIGDNNFNNLSCSFEESNLGQMIALKYVGENCFFKNNFSQVNLSQCSNLLSIGTRSFKKVAGWEIDDNNAPNYYPPILLPKSSPAGFTSWYLGDSIVASHTIVYNLERGLISDIYYTLQDDDVTVLGGVLKSIDRDLYYANIVVPSRLDGQTVTVIGNVKPSNDDDDERIGAFNNGSFREIVLPSTIREIDDYAFSGSSLQIIDWSACVNLKSIGYESFKSCQLSEVDFSSLRKLEKIGGCAFEFNNITSVNLNACQNLTTVEYPFSYNPLASIMVDSCSALEQFSLINDESDYHTATSILLPTPDDTQYTQWHTLNGETFDAGSSTTAVASTFFLPAHHTVTDEDVVVKDGYIIKYTYEGFAPFLEIPEYLDGQQVIGISVIDTKNDESEGDQFNNRFITNLTLPTSLEMIDDYSFADNDLKSVNFDELENLNYVGDCAFDLRDWDSLVFATSDFTKLGIYCRYIDYIDAASWQNVETFGGEMFRYCYFGDTLDLSSFSNLKTLENGGFYRSDFKHVDLSGCSALTLIEENAFYDSNPSIDLTGCTSLLLFQGDDYYQEGFIDTANILLPTPELDGVTFTGWIDNAGNTNVSHVTDFNKTYTATFDSPYIMVEGETSLSRVYPGQEAYFYFNIYNISQTDITISDIKVSEGFEVNYDRSDFRGNGDDYIRAGGNIFIIITAPSTKSREYFGEMEIICNEAKGDKLVSLYANVIDIEGVNRIPADIVGCMDEEASNFDASANTSGVCIYDISGCLDSTAINYNPLANVDNDNCIFNEVYGCMEATASNYNNNATVENGTCVFDTYTYGCTDANANNYDPSANMNSGYCEYDTIIFGCMDATAQNYNPQATRENGSCIFASSITYGCTDSIALNYNINATIDNGNCIYNVVNDEITGCTYLGASNFNVLATIDDGSCDFSQGESVQGCTYPAAINYNPAAHVDDGSCFFARPLNSIADTTGTSSISLEIVGTAPVVECAFDFATAIDSVLVSDITLLGDSVEVQWNIYQGNNVSDYTSVYPILNADDLQLYFSLVCNTLTKSFTGLEKVKALTVSAVINIDDVVAGTSDDTFYGQKESYSIYPIPVEDRLYIAFESDQKDCFEAIIYDMQGRVVASQNMFLDGQSKTNVDVSFLNSGAYYLRLSTNDMVLGVTKFIK